jgi:hypothetical protein
MVFCQNVIKEGVMAIEDTFNGAKNVYTLYFAYQNMVAQEIGMERASALGTKMCEAMGAMQGKMSKEQAGIEEFDARTAYPLVKNFVESIGVSSKVIEESPQKVVDRGGRCPIYEAAQMMGLDGKAIETLVCCSGSIKFLDAMVKQLNPNLSVRIRKFRSSADDFCEEEIVLG